MANHGSREGNRQEGRVAGSSAPWPPVFAASSSLLDGLSSFQALCVETGRSVLDQLMEEERESLCGAKGRHLGASDVAFWQRSEPGDVGRRPD